MSSDTLKLSALEMARLCQFSRTNNEPNLPIFQAAAKKNIGLSIFTSPAATWPNILDRVTKPTIALVCEDTAPDSVLGPTDWAAAASFKAWASMVIVHGTVGKSEHYRKAVADAQRYGRLLFVETDQAHALKWAIFLKCARTVLIIPPDEIRPVAVRSEVLN